MTVVKSFGTRFLCYEPLIKMIIIQSLWHIIVWNGCMSQGLNQYPMGALCQRIITTNYFGWCCCTKRCTLRGHSWVHFAHKAIVYCYLEFKLRYLKKLKLFSIRGKELFEPIGLREKKADGFLSFLKAFCWETDLWVTLGDFTVKKKATLGREICI